MNSKFLSWMEIVSNVIVLTSINILVVQKFNLNPHQRRLKKTKKQPTAHAATLPTTTTEQIVSSITNQRMALMVELQQIYTNAMYSLCSRPGITCLKVVCSVTFMNLFSLFQKKFFHSFLIKFYVFIVDICCLCIALSTPL